MSRATPMPMLSASGATMVFRCPGEFTQFSTACAATCSTSHPVNTVRLEPNPLGYRLFGVNAELLIDHAWGWEPCTIGDIKAYKPEFSSIGAGQVLQCPYSFEKARIVVREMADALSLDLVDKGLVTDRLTLTVGYDIENLKDPERRKNYRGEVKTDRYGREIPKHAHGTANLDGYTSSTKAILSAISALYDRIVRPGLLIRRLNLTANRVIPEQKVPKASGCEQLDLFTDYAALQERQAREDRERKREKQIQSAMLGIKKKYGKNAILKGMNFEEGAAAKERNQQIGGHHA